MANQTRAAKGLSNPVVHDTDSAIRTAIEAVRILIRRDRERAGLQNGREKGDADER